MYMSMHVSDVSICGYMRMDRDLGGYPYCKQLLEGRREKKVEDGQPWKNASPWFSRLPR